MLIPDHRHSPWLLAVALGILACNPREGRVVQDTLDLNHLPPLDTLPQLAYNGWKHYRLMCDRCHGEDARGTSFAPDLLPTFRPGGTIGSQEAFAGLMREGRPTKGMPSGVLLGLEPDDFEGLYLYLHGRATGLYSGGRPALR